LSFAERMMFNGRKLVTIVLAGIKRTNLGIDNESHQT